MRSTGFIGAVATFAAGVFSAVTPNPCTGIRDGSATLAARFTLTARNTTGPQVNATGAPLVLGPGGATDGEEFYVLATWASFPYNNWPSLNLTDGGMLAQSAIGDASAVGYQAVSDQQVGFWTTLPTPAAYPQWCALPSVNPGSAQRLALNGHSNLFTLCPGFETEVFFNQTGSAAAGCYPVELLAVPVKAHA